MENPPSPESVSEHVGQRVLALRRARKWSRERLAQLLAAEGQPMGQNALWKIEQRPPERKITADEVAALAHVFGTTPADLMGWEPRPARVIDGWEVMRTTPRVPVVMPEIPSLEEFGRAMRHVVETTSRSLVPVAAQLQRLHEHAAASARLMKPLLDAIDVIDAHGYAGDEGRVRLFAEFGMDTPLVDIAAALQERQYIEIEHDEPEGDEV